MKNKFWSKQPMAQNKSISGQIDIKDIKDIRNEPYPLLDGFEWGLLDWDNESIVDECYKLLKDNYVEDDNGIFRFEYSREFLKWTLTPLDWKREWQVGVFQTSNRKIRAMITGTPAIISVDGSNIPIAEINFLCVHKKLRNKRLTPVLIKEITRRINLDNIWQAVFTAGINIISPITYGTYYHRSINIKKLLDVGFTILGERETIPRLNKLLKLPKYVNTPGWRPLKIEDLEQVGILLNNYLSQFRLHIVFQYHELEHIFMSKPFIISSYVIEYDGKITDFASFYHLCSNITNHPLHNTLRGAYSFYNVPGRLSIQDLIYNLVIEAKNQQCDVFNCLDIMDNKSIFENLKFKIGDGKLHYYLYNYSIGNELNPTDIGIVLS